MVKFKDFPWPLSVFQVLFKANLFFKEFSRQSCIFKYFSSLWEPRGSVSFASASAFYFLMALEKFFYLIHIFLVNKQQSVWFMLTHFILMDYPEHIDTIRMR